MFYIALLGFWQPVNPVAAGTAHPAEVGHSISDFRVCIFFVQVAPEADISLLPAVENRIGVDVDLVACRTVDDPLVVQRAFPHGRLDSIAAIVVTALTDLQLNLAPGRIASITEYSQGRESLATMSSRHMDASRAVAGFTQSLCGRRLGVFRSTVRAAFHGSHLLSGMAQQAPVGATFSIGRRSVNQQIIYPGLRRCTARHAGQH